MYISLKYTITQLRHTTRIHTWKICIYFTDYIHFIVKVPFLNMVCL